MTKCTTTDLRNTQSTPYLPSCHCMRTLRWDQPPVWPTPTLFLQSWRSVTKLKIRVGCFVVNRRWVSSGASGRLLALRFAWTPVLSTLIFQRLFGRWGLAACGGGWPVTLWSKGRRPGLACHKACRESHVGSSHKSNEDHASVTFSENVSFQVHPHLDHSFQVCQNKGRPSLCASWHSYRDALRKSIRAMCEWISLWTIRLVSFLLLQAEYFSWTLSEESSLIFSCNFEIFLRTLLYHKHFFLDY